jgi:hypothetical protein
MNRRGAAVICFFVIGAKKELPAVFNQLAAPLTVSMQEIYADMW